jgi:RNA polymerase sigma factor (sigma-70 family)
MIAAPRSEAIVYVVDDDASTRELLSWLIKRDGLRVEAFPDARSFLAAYTRARPGCLMLDLNMPGMDGLDLQRYLKDNGVDLPVIFLSGRADVPKAVRAVKEGAIDFIEKPFDYKRVMALVHDCLRRDAEQGEAREQRRRHAERLAHLTQRERDVLDLVVAGKTNREVGEALDISVKTVEAHRARLMEKLEVDSLAELVQAVVSSKR